MEKTSPRTECCWPDLSPVFLTQNDGEKMNQRKFATNLYEKIENAKFDDVVGIRIAHLTGKDEFSLFGAEIAPCRKVGAHYHKSGIEIYHIVEGNGIMHTGLPDNNNNVNWHNSMRVKKGDCFTVDEGEVHQLANENDGKLIAIICCPKSHLSTDRIVVKGYD
jgi:mannose-6-phosphate isomerase-like protein (cupin superfamily)